MKTNYLDSRGRKSGQTLAEVVVAIGVVVLLVSGLIFATSVTLKASQYGKSRSQAVQYAQEAVEAARNLREGGWTAFSAYGGALPISWCLDKSGIWTASSGSCTANIDSVYTRTVTFTWEPSNSRMKVDVLVSWTDGNKTYTVPITTYITQWK
jgi:type II secretory pathway pseudopilin PulG